LVAVVLLSTLVGNEVKADYLYMAGNNGSDTWLKKVDPATGNIVQSLASPPWYAQGLAYADTTMPSGTITVNNGAIYASSLASYLTISGADNGSGLSQMRFSNDGSTWRDWETYGSSKSWSLTSGDGLKTVYVQLKDDAGNVSDPFSDTITLDMTAPAGAIYINAGATYATKLSANLTLAATDAGSGVSLMRFSSDGSSWSDWETYGSSNIWSLTLGDGLKTVYVQFKDAAGNSSGSFSDTITLELDSDSDGLPDWWELQFFHGPTNAVATEDSDNDGQNNMQEWIAGTCPTNSTDYFRISSGKAVPEGFSFSWDSKAGRLYSIWTSTNLPPLWSNRMRVTGTGGTTTYTNVDSVPALFLRLSVEKP
jgi:hypothetical protein